MVTIASQNMDVLKPRIINIEGRCYRLNEGDLVNNDHKQTGADWDDHSNDYGNLFTYCIVNY